MAWTTSQRIQFRKTVSWTLISMLITGMIGWLISGQWQIGVTVGVADRLIKVGLYYVHERFWHKKYKALKKMKQEIQKVDGPL